MSDHPAPPWHALSVDEIVARLASDRERGLSAAEAARRRERYGENRLREQPPEPRFRKLARQFREVVVWILLVAAAIAAATGDGADAAVIVAIVLVNALIGFFQEERAQAALAALQRMAAPVAKVVRDGVPAVVPAREIVPGDLVALAAGDAVAADARLVTAFALCVQEAALTGESAPVDKEVAAVPEATPLAERTALVHAGTVVAAGRGTALVVATGMETELGRIAGLLGHARAEPTPLQRRLAELGRWLIAVCLAMVGVILALELARGGRVTDVLLRAVSLAVAAVPEGLPAVVTVVLAIGLERLVARGTLVRRLPSVETLGSVTVICTDKTGTLTRDEMTVRAIETATARYAVTGTGYAPHGEFRTLAIDGTEGGAVAVATHPDLARLLLVGARCGNATVQPDGNGWRAIGDPTEAALVVAALKGGVAGDPARPVVYELPFDSRRQRMSVVVRNADDHDVLETKGATEAVLARCTAEQRDGVVVPLSDERRGEILAAAARLAEGALRVLSLAYRELPGGLGFDGGAEAVERELVHLGLVGMIDPPRDCARAAVATCRSAGIRPVMITGDHPATALAIGRELGLVDGTSRAVTGAEVARLTDDALAAAVGEIAIYARVTAEDKLRVVRAWQRRGEVVAMTGDGVNDAPAIREADIGIAMGKSGTFVTREAADMVLTDDDFASIVGAVEEGRGIYDNIQKFIHYLLACNAGEVLVMLVAAVAGWPPPLAAIQILWLNLVTDGLPALALGLEPPESDIMERPPRPPHEALVTRSRGLVILAHGALVAAVILVAFKLSWQGSDDPAVVERARTTTFCVAAFAQLFFAVACRSDRSTAPGIGFFSNPALIAAIVISGLVQMGVVMIPVARPWFDVAADLGPAWWPVLGLALVPVTVIETGKWALRGHRPARA